MTGDAQPMPEDDALRFKANELAETFEGYGRALRAFPELFLRFGKEDFWPALEQGASLLDGTAAEEIEFDLSELDEPGDDEEP